MNNGTAKALSRFPETSRQPEAAADKPAEPAATRASWLERKDEAMSEKVTLTKGTLWLVATVLVLAGLAFNYGGSLLGWSREDAQQREKLQQITNDVQAIKQDVKALSDALRAFEIREATKRGYELKAAEGDHGNQPKEQQK